MERQCVWVEREGGGGWRRGTTTQPFLFLLCWTLGFLCYRALTLPSTPTNPLPQTDLDHTKDLDHYHYSTSIKTNVDYSTLVDTDLDHYTTSHTKSELYPSQTISDQAMTSWTISDLARSFQVRIPSDHNHQTISNYLTSLHTTLGPIISLQSTSNQSNTLKTTLNHHTSTQATPYFSTSQQTTSYHTYDKLLATLDHTSSQTTSGHIPSLQTPSDHPNTLQTTSESPPPDHSTSPGTNLTINDTGDGVHLNEVGAARLGRLLNDAVKDFRSKNGINQTQDRVVYKGVQRKSSNNRSSDPSRLLVLQNTEDQVSNQWFTVESLEGCGGGQFQRGDAAPRLIVVWTPFWHQWGAWGGILKGRGNFRESGCPVWRCQYRWGPTVTEAEAAGADAILFFSLDFLYRQPPPRLPHQRWIWLELEAPPISRLGAEAWDTTGITFNLTMSYHRRNQIVVTNGFLVTHTTSTHCPTHPTPTLDVSTPTYAQYTLYLARYDGVLRGMLGQKGNAWLKAERARRHPFSRPLRVLKPLGEEGAREGEKREGEEGEWKATVKKREKTSEQERKTIGTGGKTTASEGEKSAVSEKGKGTISEGGRAVSSEKGKLTIRERSKGTASGGGKGSETEEWTGNVTVSNQWTATKRRSTTQKRVQQVNVIENNEKDMFEINLLKSFQNKSWIEKDNLTFDKNNTQPWENKMENQLWNGTSDNINGTFLGLTQEEIELAIRPKIVAWMASHCPTESRREDLVARLSEYIPVTTVGRCGTEQCGRNHMDDHCYTWLAASHLFYLALENALCEDYVTEKLWRPLQFGMVPVVYGMGHYAEILPPGSYIDASDFSSAKALAAHLVQLAANPAQYARYLVWRRYWRVMWLAPWCDLCAALHHPVTNRPVTARKWWQDTARCRPPPAW